MRQAAQHWTAARCRGAVRLDQAARFESRSRSAAKVTAKSTLKMRLLDAFLSLLIPGLVLVHLAVAPYTKVEESFNMQATHDVLVYGTPTADVRAKLGGSYDHFAFPGAVPRTFVGPVILAGVSQPLIALAGGFRHAQLVVRAVLGLFNTLAMLAFKAALGRAYGKSVERWYTLFQASQFHVIFYASRTLPNMFAFGLTTLAFTNLLPSPNPKAMAPRQRVSISLFVLAAIIFRSEVALLLATNALYLVVAPLAPLERLIWPFAISSAMALLVSVPLDSYFWQRPLWPELWGFYYNAVLGSSSNWGVSPWHWYFTSALPRILLNPLAPFLAGLALRQPGTSRAARLLVWPNVLFVAVYSLQPHKEARFIFYVAPPLTAAAALGAAFARDRRARAPATWGLAAAAAGLSALACLAASTGMLLLSSLNYPGGEALDFVRAHAAAASAGLMGGVGAAAPGLVTVPVHACVLACMTGVTLFGTTAPVAGAEVLPAYHVVGSSSSSSRGVGGDGGDEVIGGSPAATAAGSGGSVALALDKTEDRAALARPAFWEVFDYLIVEDPEEARGGRWEVVGVVQGYAGVEVLRPGSRADDDDDDDDDVEDGASSAAGRVVGRGRTVRDVRARVRRVTGGWWVGPRMAPRLHVLRRVKGGGQTMKTAAS
ncbi:hypothetical protein RB601_004818 [Gaeumannomyces tritici]